MVLKARDNHHNHQRDQIKLRVSDLSKEDAWPRVANPTCTPDGKFQATSSTMALTTMSVQTDAEIDLTALVSTFGMKITIANYSLTKTTLAMVLPKKNALSMRTFNHRTLHPKK